MLPVLLVAAVWGAQQVAAEQELARRYDTASVSFEQQDWPQAAAGFESVVSMRPWYRDAAAKLETARREVRLLTDYGAAMERYRASAWTDAVQKLGALAADAPGYKDVDARLADAKRELRLEQQYTAAVDKVNGKAWADAIQAFEALVKESPGYRDADARLDEARRELRAATLLSMYEAAMGKVRAASWADAVSQLEALLKQDAAYRDAPARLADARRQLGLQQRLDSARAKLERRLYAEAVPELDSLARSDFSGKDRAVELLDRGRKDYAAELSRQARSAFDTGKYSEAERLARSAIEQHKDVRGARIALGNALRRLDRDDEAREVLLEATKIDASAEAFNLLGWAHLDATNPDLRAAEAALREAIRLNPTYANAMVGLGQFQLQSKQPQAADSAFQQALALDPKEAAAYQGLGQVALTSGDLPGAIRHYRKAVENAGDDHYAEGIFRKQLAAALLGLDDFGAAKAELEAAQRLLPDDHTILGLWGTYYRRQDNHLRAIEFFDAALAKSPNEASYHRGRGLALIELERYAEALTAGNRVVELGATDRGHVIRSLAYAGMRDFPRARQAARQALDANPNNKDAQEILTLLAA